MKKRKSKKRILNRVTWHFQVCKIVYKKLGESFFCIKEIIRINGLPDEILSVEPSIPYGDTKKELVATLKRMLKDARNHPVRTETIK